MEWTEETKELDDSLQKLLTILAAEGGDDFLPTVQSMACILREGASPGGNWSKALSEAAQRWDSLNRCQPYSDFFLWRETVEERIRANAPLDQLNQRITTLLGKGHP